MSAVEVVSLPAIPDPVSAPVAVLQHTCAEVRLWAEDCDDVAQVYEALSKISAIEEYLSKKGQEAPAQEAARWLEVRIGELLGDPVVGRPKANVTRELQIIPAMDRVRFRKLAAHRDLVEEMVPASRNRILKVIKQAEAGDKADVAPPHLRVVTDEAPEVFSCVVIDPPWRYDNVATRGAAEDHYPTMSLDELAALTIPAAADSHLYLWVTNGFLRQGFDLLDAWGFTYKTVLTWCKPSIGMGNYFRNNTEHVLFALRGKLPTQRNDIGTWFEAPKTRHSAKPESFYDLVERCSPGPFLEMFARRRRLDLGGEWHFWGNEA